MKYLVQLALIAVVLLINLVRGNPTPTQSTSTTARVNTTTEVLKHENVKEGEAQLPNSGSPKKVPSKSEGNKLGLDLESPLPKNERKDRFFGVGIASPPYPYGYGSPNPYHITGEFAPNCADSYPNRRYSCYGLGR